MRNEYGYEILTHNDDDKIKAGYYVLKNSNPKPKGYKFERKISARTRFLILERNGFTCQTCGYGPGDIHPATKKKVRLQIGHHEDKSSGGSDDMGNLFAQCMTCNAGASNITPSYEKHSRIINMLRKSDRKTQLGVRDWLNKKYQT